MKILLRIALAKSIQIYPINNGVRRLFLSGLNGRIRCIVEYLRAEHYIVIINNDYDNIITDLAENDFKKWVNEPFFS